MRRCKCELPNRETVRTGEDKVTRLAICAYPFGGDMCALAWVDIPILGVKYCRPVSPWFGCVVDAELVYTACLGTAAYHKKKTAKWSIICNINTVAAAWKRENGPSQIYIT